MPSRQQCHSAFIAALVLGAVLCAAGTTVEAQPVNNECSAAIEIFADSPVGGTTVGATGTDINSCAGGNDSLDVWYYYVPTDDGIATFDLCEAASFDTSLSVFTGCGGVEIGCDDDACGSLRSSVSVAVSNGSPCYVRVAGYGGEMGTFTLSASLTTGGGGGSGPDVVYSDTVDITNWGAVGGIRGYSLGSYTCNIGNTNLPWNSTSPLLGMNAYRLENGRLMQIGMSWLKNATVAAAGNGCGMSCNGTGGSQLGAGCRDIYSASYNGGQGILGPRSQCNAYTGQYPGPSGGTGNAIFKRLQIAQADIDPALHPTALYFSEGVYVAATDALAGNALNNASHKRFTVTAGTFNLSPTGSMQVGVPAIQAWQNHGGGVNVPDPSVAISTVDVPDEGRFYMAAKVTPLGNGTWRYDYAIYNLNSHRAASSFTVPIPAGTTVTNVGFHDVDYHSGEPFDNTDWIGGADDSSVSWKSPQTFAQNPNTNALRFGTMYNFWFDADVGPKSGSAAIGLFRPGTPESVAATVAVPGACAGDCFVDGLRDGNDVQAYVDCLMVGGKSCACADFLATGTPDIGSIDAFTDAILIGTPCP
ncbi:MAG: hypothetical protein DCC65_11300 [Planctomycetota bacterium]|nr:MAG: hypothetical protein DCC65_11300 [Planctomycetota bacterium]